MLTLIAVILSLLFLPNPWAWLVVGAAVGIDALEIAIWLRMRNRKSIAGSGSMLGVRATTITVCRPDGRVRLQGQIWKAHCDEGADAGVEVTVTGVTDLVLTVERVRSETPQVRPD